MKKKKVETRFIGDIVQLSRVELLQYIPPQLLHKLKEEYDNPTLVLLNIGAEGSSKGNITNMDQDAPWYKQMWNDSSIEKLISRIKKSAGKIFIGHNENEKRKSVGAVIYALKKLKHGIINAFAVAHIFDKKTIERIDSGELNTCSIEATCLFSKGDDGNSWVVEDVKKFNGIALADSQEDNPGFESATVMGMLAALAKDSDDDDDKYRKRKAANMDLQETILLVKNQGWSPEQLFDSKALTDCNIVKGVIQSEVDEKMKKIADERDKLKEELIPLRKAQANGRIPVIVESSKLLEKESKKLVQYLKDSLKIDVSDLNDDEAKIAIDKEIENQLKHLSSAGVTFEDKKDQKNADDKSSDDSGKISSDDSSSNNGNGKKDYTDAKDNPLIPK